MGTDIAKAVDVSSVTAVGMGPFVDAVEDPRDTYERVRFSFLIQRPGD